MRETPKAKAAYLEYAMMGPARSLRKLLEHLGGKWGKGKVSLKSLEAWSSIHQWQTRVTLFDKECADKQRIEQEEAVHEMNQRHITLAKEAQQLAFDRIKALIDNERFSATPTVQLLDIAAKLERLASGSATERREQDTTISGNPDAPLVVKTQWGTSETPLEDGKSDEP